MMSRVSARRLKGWKLQVLKTCLFAWLVVDADVGCKSSWAIVTPTFFFNLHIDFISLQHGGWILEA